LQAFQLENGAGIPTVIGTVHADVQDDLAASHARRLAAGELEFQRLFEVALAQAPDVGGVPVAMNALVDEATRLVVNYLQPAQVSRGA
jgi:hypothetical protein